MKVEIYAIISQERKEFENKVVTLIKTLYKSCLERRRADHRKELTAWRNGYRPFQRAAVGQLNPTISKEFYPDHDEAVHLPYAAILTPWPKQHQLPAGGMFPDILFT
uniref:Uncharacterized protein n=1 Tax=Glossina pallidipes TaxID=7398 RepID=A0A1A9ZLY6_GLOPL